MPSARACHDRTGWHDARTILSAEPGMKRLASLTDAAAPCAGTLAPAPAQALTDDRKRALAAILIIGPGVASARHGDDHHSTPTRDDERRGRPFSPNPGVVSPPQPRHCHRNGEMSWRWTQRTCG